MTDEPQQPLGKTEEAETSSVAQGSAPGSEAGPRVPLTPGVGLQYTLPGFPTVLGFQQTQVWQGQFPPPEAIERYELVLPGAFDRILTMAEKQQDAGIAEAMRATAYRRGDIRRAHYLGAAVAGGAMICSLIALHMGSPIVAGAFLTVPVFSVARAIFETVRPKQRPATPTARPEA